MNVAISAMRTKNIRINRHELVTSILKSGHSVTYIGQESEDRIHPDYEKYNVKFLGIPLGRSNINPLKELHTIIETRKLLKENNIEAIIIYGIRTFPSIDLAAKLAGIKKVICIVNGTGILFQMDGLKGLIVKGFSYPMLVVSFLLSNSILFQNKDDLKMIQNKKLLWNKNYNIVNGSGVNLDEFESLELNRKPTFLMISRITGSKGVNE